MANYLRAREFPAQYEVLGLMLLLHAGNAHSSVRRMSLCRLWILRHWDDSNLLYTQRRQGDRTGKTRFTASRDSLPSPSPSCHSVPGPNLFWVCATRTECLEATE